MTVISDVKKAPEATFHMKDRETIYWFLGPGKKREEGKIRFDQERFLETIIKRFQMDQIKPSGTPFDLNFKF